MGFSRQEYWSVLPLPSPTISLHIYNSIFITVLIFKHIYKIGHFKWSEVAQTCLTLCNPMACSLPGSSVHGIFQARILEWVAISFSIGHFKYSIKNEFWCTCVCLHINGIFWTNKYISIYCLWKRSSLYTGIVLFCVKPICCNYPNVYFYYSISQ